MNLKHSRHDEESDPVGARKAILSAELSLMVAESRTGLVSELTNRLRIERSENHFIQRLNMHKERNDRT